MARNRKLTKRDLQILYSISDKLDKLRFRYNEDEGTDIELQIKSNGTIGGNIACALASLDTILQEYAPDFQPETRR